MGDRVFGAIILVLVTILLLIVLYPLYFTVIASVSNPDMVNLGKVWLYPVEITFDGYKKVFENEEILIGYRNTIFYTLGGTMVNLFLTLPAAYALTRKELQFKKIITFFFVFTMYFSGGMIPTYLIVRDIGLLNTWTCLMVTAGISTFNLILARTFFSSIPTEIQESAFCDGCSDLRTFISIVLPLSKALLGVLVLYYGIDHWNGYFRALLYLTDRNKVPLQLVLREILISQQMAASMMEDGGDEDAMVTALRNASLIKYAVIIVSSLPMIILYPFLQKYFDKGVMLGSVKG